MDREEAETGPGPKRWLVSVLGEDHDIALTQWEAEEEEMVLLLDGEVVQYRESKLDPELLRFTVGEADAVLRLQDERHSLYIGGEFIPGELLTEDVANAEEATLSEQQRVQRYMIGERQEGDNLQPWQAMVKEGNRARNMLGLLAFAGIAALLSVIMANGEIAPSIPSPAIWLLWGLSAVLGFMGINSIVSRESTLGILFGLFGTKTFGGVWSDVTAVIMLALCVLFFSVPFFAE